MTTNKNGEVGIQQTLGKGSKFEKFGSEKEAARALGNYTAGYNTTERSKEDPHSNEALLHKHWDKETEQIRKENKQADMKKEVLEYLSHTMARENAEAFLDKASPKMLRTMYNNLKYKIPGENKKLHEAEPAASSEEKKSLKNVLGYSVYRDGESRNGYYREYRNGDDIIRYDQNGYDDRAEGKKYSAMESGPGGKRRFFNSLQEAADWIKKGSPRDAAPKLTGDCKIRIRK